MDNSRDDPVIVEEGTITDGNPSRKAIGGVCSFKNGGATYNKETEDYSDSSSFVIGGSNGSGNYDDGNNYWYSTNNDKTSKDGGCTAVIPCGSKRPAEGIGTGNNNCNTPPGNKPTKKSKKSKYFGGVSSARPTTLFSASAINTGTESASTTNRGTAAGRDIISSTNNQNSDSDSSSSSDLSFKPIPLKDALVVVKNSNGYDPDNAYYRALHRWKNNAGSRTYDEPPARDRKVTLYQWKPENVNVNELSINSYYSFSLRDVSTNEWVPFLTSSSANNAVHRFKEIDITSCGNTIRKAAGDTVAGIPHTPQLLKNVIKVEKINKDILESKLGWMCSKDDAKAALTDSMSNVHVSSYYSFSLLDQSTKKWLPFLTSRSSNNAMHRFKEIGLETHTPRLLKKVIKVEKIEEEILESKLGWMYSKDDAKAALTRALVADRLAHSTDHVAQACTRALEEGSTGAAPGMPLAPPSYSYGYGYYPAWPYTGQIPPALPGYSYGYYPAWPYTGQMPLAPPSYSYGHGYCPVGPYTGQMPFPEVSPGNFSSNHMPSSATPASAPVESSMRGIAKLVAQMNTIGSIGGLGNMGSTICSLLTNSLATGGGGYGNCLLQPQQTNPLQQIVGLLQPPPQQQPSNQLVLQQLQQILGNQSSAQQQQQQLQPSNPLQQILGNQQPVQHATVQQTIPLVQQLQQTLGIQPSVQQQPQPSFEQQLQQLSNQQSQPPQPVAQPSLPQQQHASVQQPEVQNELQQQQQQLQQQDDDGAEQQQEEPATET